MPHQCTRCGKIYPDAANELLVGCVCSSRFFYYIRQEKLDQLKREKDVVLEHLEKADKDQIEKDIRELTGLDKNPEEPVILDLESIRVIRPGKFEIDLVNLFSKNRPLIYKLEEGKYIIDLSMLNANKKNQTDTLDALRFGEDDNDDLDELEELEEEIKDNIEDVKDNLI